jgi:hypothetical protein
VLPLPLPSKAGPEPYPSAALEFLQPGVTTRAEVTAKLGEPSISRAGGTVLVYGAARDSGGWRLMLLPYPVTVGTDEFFLLFIEIGPDGTLAHHELVEYTSQDIMLAEPSRPICSSTGICVLRSEWSRAGVPYLWEHSDQIRRGDRALITATAASEARARTMVAPALGCQIYFWVRYPPLTWAHQLTGQTWGKVYFGIDDEPEGLFNAPPYEDLQVFALWNLPAGEHTLSAMRKDGTEVANHRIDCHDGETTAVEGVVIPTFAGTEARAKFVAQDLKDASRAIAERRLLLLD